MMNGSVSLDKVTEAVRSTVPLNGAAIALLVTWASARDAQVSGFVEPGLLFLSSMLISIAYWGLVTMLPEIFGNPTKARRIGLFVIGYVFASFAAGVTWTFIEVVLR